MLKLWLNERVIYAIESENVNFQYNWNKISRKFIIFLHSGLSIIFKNPISLIFLFLRLINLRFWFDFFPTFSFSRSLIIFEIISVTFIETFTRVENFDCIFWSVLFFSFMLLLMSKLMNLGWIISRSQEKPLWFAHNLMVKIGFQWITDPNDSTFGAAFVLADLHRPSFGQSDRNIFYKFLYSVSFVNFQSNNSGAFVRRNLFILDKRLSSFSVSFLLVTFEVLGQELFPWSKLRQGNHQFIVLLHDVSQVLSNCVNVIQISWIIKRFTLTCEFETVQKYIVSLGEILDEKTHESIWLLLTFCYLYLFVDIFVSHCHTNIKQFLYQCMSQIIPSVFSEVLLNHRHKLKLW